MIEAQDPTFANIVDLVILETGLSKEGLKPATRLEDTAITSYDMLAVVFQIEEVYGVEFHEGDVGPVDTFGDLVEELVSIVRRRRA